MLSLGRTQESVGQGHALFRTGLRDLLEDDARDTSLLQFLQFASELLELGDIGSHPGRGSSHA